MAFSRKLTKPGSGFQQQPQITTHVCYFWNRNTGDRLWFALCLSAKSGCWARSFKAALE